MSRPIPLPTHQRHVAPSAALAAACLGALAWAASGQAQAQPAAPVPRTAANAPQDKALPTVNVTDSQTREAIGYNPGTSNVGRSQQALKDIPNSVTVVPEQLMHDRNADSFKEALRNVAGLTFNAGEGGRVGDNITLRGFSVVGDLYLDNIRDIAQYNRETFNLESIDILRGSASMLYGRGSAGGLINQVSKTPHRYGGNELAITLGTDNYKRVTADITHALNDTTVLRVNALAHDADSSRDVAHNSRYALAPTVVFGLGTAQQLTLAYHYLKEDNIPDYGVPYFRTPGADAAEPLPVSAKTFYGLGNADYERNSASIATATYQHKLSNTSMLKTALRGAHYARDLWVTAPRLAAGTTEITPNTVVNRSRPARGGEEHTLTSQTDFTTRFNTGGVQHEALFGIELAREESKRWTNANGSSNPPSANSQIASPSTTVLNPDAFAALPANYFSTQFRYNPNSFVANTRGLYAQTTAQIAPAWKLVAGLRHDQFVSNYERTLPLTPLARTDRVLSKKLGVLFQPKEELSYYASWGTSFNPSGELYQLDPAGSNTPPELNRNIEIGAKWDLMDGDLAIRTAVYRTEKTNERNTDVASPNLFLLSGKRHTTGGEIEVAGRVTAAWEVFAALALQEGRITQASGQQAGSLNRTPVNTPPYTLSLWNTYKLTDRLKLGGGIEAVGKRYVNTANTALLPAYERVDMMAEYKVGAVAYQLNVKNLLNRVYYEGLYTGHTVPGTLRSATLAASYKF